MINKYLCFVIAIFFIHCKSNTITTNEIALELAKLENKGIISQSDKKDGFFMFLSEIYQNFEDYGYGHRITEMTPTWRLYEDNAYLIMTGSVAKSDKNVFMFTVLFQDKGSGVFNIVYEEVGKMKTGIYPKDIIPYK